MWRWISNTFNKHSDPAHEAIMNRRLEQTNDILQNAIRLFVSRRPSPQVKLELIKKNSVNAFARPDQAAGKYLIGIHDALFVEMDKALTIFSENLRISTFQNDSGLSFSQATWDSLDGDPVGAVTRMVYKHSVHFLMLHEAAHIINGHLDFLKAAGAINIISEMHESGRKDNFAFVKQAMEFNADSTALITWTAQTLNVIKTMSQGTLSRHTLHHERDLRFLIWSMFLAIGCLFKLLGHKSYPRLIGYGHYNPQTLEADTHPPLFMRVANLADQLDRWIGKRHPEYATNVNDLATNAYTYAEICFMPNAEANKFHGIDFSNDPIMQEHFIKVARALQRLLPSLESYKFGGQFGRVEVRDD
jgi:hypothetical protein